jgi:hypothetical protein
VRLSEKVFIAPLPSYTGYNIIIIIAIIIVIIIIITGIIIVAAIITPDGLQSYGHPPWIRHTRPSVTRLPDTSV